MNQSVLPKKKKGEPHRIYWQQWIQKSSTTTTDTTSSSVAYSWEHTQSSLEEQHNTQRFNRRELIISSAAIRLSRSAKVIDVTTLLRQTLQLPPLSTVTTTTTDDSNTTTGSTRTDMDMTSISSQNDCLVLVGTIYTLHKNFIEYQHSINRQSQYQPQQRGSIYSNDNDNNNNNSDEYSEPYHIVRTLHINESPLVAYEAMEKYISNFLDQYNIYMTSKSNLIDSCSTSNLNVPVSLPSSSKAISPKIQWYYIPAAIVTESTISNNTNNNSNNNTGTMIPNCVELDGYCTSMEEGDEDDDDDNDFGNKEGDGYKSNTRECGDTDSIDENSFLSSPEEQQIQQKLYAVFPWLKEQNNVINPEQSLLHTTNIKSSFVKPISKQYSKKVQRKLNYQDDLYSDLCLSESQTPIHACLSGYLLYRHRHDIHVWRRMFCILTNHELWYISRIYTRTDKSNSIDNYETSNVVSVALQDDNETRATTAPENIHTNSKLRYRYVRHARIRLTRAILIQPTPDEPSLFRIPYAFEVVSSDGMSHIFRTNSKQQHTIWMSAISERIILSYESSILDNAELIMTEECVARNRRSTIIAVEPIWDQMIRVMSDPSLSSSSNNISNILVYPPMGNSIGSVLRFGMDISIYKDRCRNVRSSIPTRTPIVVATPAPRRRFFSTASSSSITATSRDDKHTTTPSTSSEVKYEPYEPYIQNMLRITWDQAKALLSRARSLALTLQLRSSIQHDSQSIEQQLLHEDGHNNSVSGSNPSRIRLSHSVDTLCRHIEFVLTGSIDYRMKQSIPKDDKILDNDTTMTITSPQSTTSSRQNDGPPPDDLFDQLLMELQSLAAVADRRFITHPNHHPQNASNPNIIVSQQS